MYTLDEMKTTLMEKQARRLHSWYWFHSLYSHAMCFSYFFMKRMCREMWADEKSTLKSVDYKYFFHHVTHDYIKINFFKWQLSIFHKYTPQNLRKSLNCEESEQTHSLAFNLIPGIFHKGSSKFCNKSEHIGTWTLLTNLNYPRYFLQGPQSLFWLWLILVFSGK